MTKVESEPCFCRRFGAETGWLLARYQRFIVLQAQKSDPQVALGEAS
ncbi:hypothetical protein [Comamonas sp.]|nr:hypothetical protein [Comamonas sp.]